MIRVTAFVICLAALVAAGPIETLGAGEWVEVPNTHLESVKPNPEPGGWTGIRSVMNAWCGGTFDTKRDRLIVWGGGHADYSGNEVYVFDLNTLNWERVSNPSTDVGGTESTGEYPDGNPRSRHTYAYIQYVASIDRFCTFGGHGLYPSGQVGTTRSHAFNFDTRTWARIADCPSMGIGAFSAYDPSTGHAWCHGTQASANGVLSEYNSIADTWTKRTGYNNDLAWSSNLNAAIDPVNRKFVVIGGGNCAVFNIANPASVTRTNPGGGSGGAPGFDYDAKARRLVAWSGGKSVQVFNGADNSWSTVSGTGATPTAPDGNGTYGRFRYSPAKNVFVLVNSVSTNVFLFRLTEGSGTQVERRPATAGNLNVRISPNPFKSVTSITLPVGMNPKDVEVEIFTPEGRKICDFQRAESELYVNAAGFPAGVYMARIKSGGRTGVQRLVVLR